MKIITLRHSNRTAHLSLLSFLKTVMTDQPKFSSGSAQRQRKITISLALTIVSTIGIGFIAFLANLRSFSGGEQYPKVLFLVGAAILGSLVNQPFRDSEESSSNEPSLLILYLAWKSVVAIVFAIIVNLIFISGVVSGTLFPSFSATKEAYSNMIHWSISIDPQTNADMAKMLLWSFLAGFSEKLVPNMISKIFADTK